MVDEERRDEVMIVMMNGEPPSEDFKILPMPRPSDLPTTKSSHNSRVFSSGLIIMGQSALRSVIVSDLALTIVEDVWKLLHEERSLKVIFSSLKDVVKGSMDFLGSSVSS